jgi:ABC-2 type transport system ATP-binding protein
VYPVNNLLKSKSTREQENGLSLPRWRRGCWSGWGFLVGWLLIFFILEAGLLMNEVISLQKVCKQLGQRQILKDVTLEVSRGDIFGYLGPNGAGKTTTIRIILGLMLADSGRVDILGRSAEDDSVREKIGFVLESDGLYDNLTAYNNLSFYGQLYTIDNLDSRIQSAVRTVGLEPRINDKVGTYSKGMRQRLALARALVPDPEVLVLDEPTSGVDPTGQIEIRQIMLDMVHKHNKTILLSSHNLDEVQRICNRIALINHGQIRLYGELEKLQHQMSRNESTIETAEPLPPAVVSEIQNLPGITIKSQSDRAITLATGGNDISNVVTLLALKGVKIEQVKKQETTLEEMYTTILKEAEQK